MSSATITIFHNPACGTSRNTLALIRHSGVEPVIVEYLVTPEAVLDILPSPQRAGFAKEDGERVVDEKGHRVAP